MNEFLADNHTLTMDVFTVVVFLYTVKVAYFQQCTVRTLRVDADKTGTRLNGHTYITFSNIGPNACYNECIRRTKCHSFNYNSITRRCDINKITNSSETDFVDETNCVYVDMTQYRGVSKTVPQTYRWGIDMDFLRVSLT